MSVSRPALVAHLLCCLLSAPCRSVASSFPRKMLLCFYQSPGDLRLLLCSFPRALQQITSSVLHKRSVPVSHLTICHPLLRDGHSQTPEHLHVPPAESHENAAQLVTNCPKPSDTRVIYKCVIHPCLCGKQGKKQFRKISHLKSS